MKREVVGSMSEWSGMLKDLFRQINDGSIGQEEMRKFLEHKNPFKPESQADVIERLLKIARDKSNFLRLISGNERIVIAPTSRRRIIADAKGVFSGYIDPDFYKWKADEAGKPTPETPVQVYELVQDATFAQMFPNPDKIVLTQDQIIEFVEKHRQWLRRDGYATFFLFKSYNQFFVADVGVGDDGRLYVLVHRIENDGVWYAGYRSRVVFPQPA